MSFTKRLPVGRRMVAVLLTLTMLLVSVAVSATVMIYTDLARLVELSDVVVHGRVVDQDMFFDDERDEIATITTVEVEHTFLGDKIGETVQFRQWGGEWNDRVARIPGDAQFAPYEEVVLFLVDGKDAFAGMRYLTALGQSKFTVYRTGQRAFVTRSLEDMAFFDPDSKEVAPRKDEGYDFDAFTAELESLVAGIKGGDQ